MTFGVNVLRAGLAKTVARWKTSVLPTLVRRVRLASMFSQITTARMYIILESLNHTLQLSSKVCIPLVRKNKGGESMKMKSQHVV
jgi:hypothetical protein